MQQVVRASTPWAVLTDSPEKRTRAPQVVEAAVVRLRWISLTCAVMTALLVYLESRLQPETEGLLKGPVLPPVWLFVILFSLGR